MEKKELIELREARRRVERASEALCTLRENARCVSGVVYGEKIAGGEKLSKQQRYMELAEKYEARYQAALDDYLARFRRVEAAMRGFSIEEKRLIVLRYARGLSWEEVNGEMGISRGRSQHMVGSILRRLARKK